MIRVAIIEDQMVIRNGLAFMIDSDPEFTAAAYASAEEALENLSKFRPHVILMDIGLPGIDGIEATRIIRDKYPQILVMMCTVFEDDEKIFNALEAGASGYILKKSSPAAILNSIRELHEGGSPMSGQIARKLVAYFQRPRIKVNSGELAELTSREKEILQLLSEGYRNKEIADKLCVSLSTIRSHIYNMYEKLHVHSRVEAVNKLRRIQN